MKVLLDTHVVLDLLERTGTLGARASAVIERADATAVSTLAFAEIGIKAATGKLRMPPDAEHRIRDAGVGVLHVTPADGLGLGDLPLHHRDPFDRLLVSQAINGGWTIVTRDAHIARYAVDVLDPRT